MVRLSPRRRGRASERIAEGILENLGYKVIETHRKVIVNGVETSEVDLIVEDSKGERYAVEVKSGRLDVTGVRQAYVNGKVLGLKPMVVCKGFSDDAAKALASELDVKVIELKDMFIVDPEEIEEIVRVVIEDIASELLTCMARGKVILDDEEVEFLRKIVECELPSPNIDEEFYEKFERIFGVQYSKRYRRKLRKLAAVKLLINEIVKGIAKNIGGEGN